MKRKCLAVGIILLFVESCIIPVIAQDIEKPLTSSAGNWLYIGGSGPRNYTQTSPNFQLKTNPYVYEYNYYPQWKSRASLDQQRNVGEKLTPSLSTPCLTERPTGNYTPHGPIWIEGDENFTAENGVSSGSGTMNDPYIIEGWEIISQTDSGIVILFTRSYFIIRNCYLETNFGICTYDVANGTFDNILFNCFGSVGLQLEISSNISLYNLTINAWTGFQAYGLKYLRMINCTFSCSNPGGYGIGFYLQTSSFTELSHLTLHDYYIGIELVFTPHSTISDCVVYDNLAGLVIGSSPYQTLKRNQLYNNTYNLDIFEEQLEGHTIEVYYNDIDMSNTINGKPIYYLYNQSDLVFDETSEVGFLGLIHCSNITVKNMVMTNTGVGVLFVATSDSSVTSCTFTYCTTAIGFFYGSQRNVIENCLSDDAVHIEWAPNNILRNNTLNYPYFSVIGDTLQDFYQDIDRSNTVGGKPIYYLVEKKNQVFKESNVGWLAFINCKNIIIKNVKINSISDGILVVHSKVLIHNSVFSNNFYGLHFINKSFAWVYNSKISSNSFGIEFDRSSAIAIVKCDISENMVGLDFINSHDVIIRNCNIANNVYHGFQITNSQDNLISANTITANEGAGINMWGDCRGNEICGNTISSGVAGIQLLQDVEYVPGQILLSPQENTIHHNDICQMGNEGITLDYNADRNVIHHNNITENHDGIYLWNCGANNTIVNNNIHGNFYGARGWNCNVNVTENWWGSADGPSGMGHGMGDAVMQVVHAKIRFDPWLEQAAKTKPTLLQCFLTRLRVRLRSFAQ